MKTTETREPARIKIRQTDAESVRLSRFCVRVSPYNPSVKTSLKIPIEGRISAAVVSRY